MSPRHLCVVFALLAAGCINEPEEQELSERLDFGNREPGVVINEFLVDPLQSQPEFIELYNAGSAMENLAGWSIADAPTASGNITTYTIAPKGSRAELPPGGYAVVAPESSGNAAGSRLMTYYDELATGPGVRVFIIPKRSTLSLNNNGDRIRLIDADGKTVDILTYSESWHNPANRSTKRISLEKYHPLLPSDSPASWTSSTNEKYGATPGRANSVYVPFSRSVETLSLSPDPFSPNGDGTADVLTVLVSLPAGAWQIAVSIYDALGSKVKTLAAGMPAGPVTALAWDGRDDDGRPVPAGRYLVTMQAAGTSSPARSASGSVALVR